jgi:5'-phosphate synthase pdxT subunit
MIYQQKNVGILAIQGSFAEHGEILHKLHVPFVFVRSNEELKNITHLIIPGGESTTMMKLLNQYYMWQMLVEKVQNKSISIFGTCAGAILCQKLGMDIEVDRNSYGAQQHSFSIELESGLFPNLRGIFIRAPRFTSVGTNVKVLATHSNEPVLLQQDNFLASSFHPELCDEMRVHEYFLSN